MGKLQPECFGVILFSENRFAFFFGNKLLDTCTTYLLERGIRILLNFLVPKTLCRRSRSNPLPTKSV